MSLDNAAEATADVSSMQIAGAAQQRCLCQSRSVCFGSSIHGLSRSLARRAWALTPLMPKELVPAQDSTQISNAECAFQESPCLQRCDMFKAYFVFGGRAHQSLQRVQQDVYFLKPGGAEESQGP